MKYVRVWRKRPVRLHWRLLLLLRYRVQHMHKTLRPTMSLMKKKRLS
jgi:hypothetical protein